MNGYEECEEKEEFNNFIHWYTEKKGVLIPSDFEDKRQYKDESGRRIAFTVGKERYMLAEDIYTEFYYDFFDK